MNNQISYVYTTEARQRFEGHHIVDSVPLGELAPHERTVIAVATDALLSGLSEPNQSAVRHIVATKQGRLETVLSVAETTLTLRIRGMGDQTDVVVVLCRTPAEPEMLLAPGSRDALH